MISFFRRLMGRSAEHVRESERFKQNLQRLEEKEEELAELHDQLKAIQARSSQRAEAYTRITSSMTPPPMEEPDGQAAK